MSTILLTSSKVELRFFNDVNRSIQVPAHTNSVQQRCQLAGDIETNESQILFEGPVTSPANYVPLTPTSFLERAANVFYDRTSVVFGSSMKYTWEETHYMCLKLASALVNLGISPGDVGVLDQLSGMGVKFNEEIQGLWLLSTLPDSWKTL
ncbi:hypothetical protein FXO37_19873 [Capsicum annuum]|nr:hypothetical protein FXO37_19873 [Capsicum annuum]